MGEIVPSPVVVHAVIVGFGEDDRVIDAELQTRGMEFLTAGIADLAGVQTTWCHDPWAR